MDHFFKKFGFSKASILSGIFLALILCSWYSIRSIRNEMAVQNVDSLPWLLMAAAIVMFLMNPIYSWVASRSNLKKILTMSYSFFILNIIALIGIFEFELLSNENFSKMFYVWANIYSFFTVSIFWVIIINIFKHESNNYYGIISAGGSIGAFAGATATRYFAESFNENGILLFGLFAISMLIIATFLGLRIIDEFNKDNQNTNKTGGGSLDSVKNIFLDNQIRNIAIFMHLWPALMTVHWITSIGIIDDWTSDSSTRINFFGLIDQIQIPLTLIIQLFLFNFFLKSFGAKNILISYGFIFVIVYIGYFFFPSIIFVAIATIMLRVFEYGISKPTREVVFSKLNQNNRTKSTVMVETFVARAGDLSGSGFIAGMKYLTLSSSVAPLFAIPIAGVLSFLGYKITKK